MMYRYRVCCINGIVFNSAKYQKTENIYYVTQANYTTYANTLFISVTRIFKNYNEKVKETY